MTCVRTKPYAFLLALALALPASAEDSNTQPTAGQADGQAGAEQSVSESKKAETPAVSARRPLPIYVPKLDPRRAVPRGRVGGGTRGAIRALPILVALAPDHVGLTSRAQPTLYWFSSAATELRIDFTLVDADAIEPVAEFTIPGPVEAGVHAVRLSEHGVRLEPGRSYQWYVAAVPDPQRRSNDVVAGGAIEYAPLASEVEQALAREGATRHAHVYAAEGIWYDAVSSVSDRIGHAPADERLRQERAALLEDVQLDLVADFDRGRGGP